MSHGEGVRKVAKSVTYYLNGPLQGRLVKVKNGEKMETLITFLPSLSRGILPWLSK